MKRIKAEDREKMGKELRKTFEAEISDTEAYLEEAAERLREVWKIFSEMKPKDVINDETTFRELKDRFGSPFGWGEYFRGGMGAESVRDLLDARSSSRPRPSCSRRRSTPPRARSRPARSSASRSSTPSSSRPTGPTGWSSTWSR